MNRRQFRSFALVLLTSSLVAGCNLSSPRRPSIVIISPPIGSQFSEGENVAIQATATDPSGITRIELIVDNAVVTSKAPERPLQSFTVNFAWQAIAGSHAISVRAHNLSDIVSDPATVQVAVIPRGGPAAAPTSGPTALGSPVPTPRGSPNTCTDDAAFVMDVTIPDGTIIKAGQNFDKTWRVRNTGNCTWGAGYQLIFIGGQVMSNTTAFPVSAAAPGAIADLTASMTTPNRSGTLMSLWRLRNPAGVVFGVTLTSSIRVTTQASPTSCSGTPNIESFAAAPTTITAGQSATLNWGLVSNAQTAEIDNDIGGIATPGSIAVRPSVTTTYTLTAYCANSSTTRQVTIDVVPVAAPTPAPPTATLNAPSSTTVPR